jgi:hypothetical protein
MIAAGCGIRVAPRNRLINKSGGIGSVGWLGCFNDDRSAVT